MTPPRTFLLYCKELPDREAAARAHLAARGVGATFFRSFHGRAWGLHTDKEYDKGKRIPPGHVGLNLGAWSLWQHMLLTSVGPDEPMIVLEDDAVLPENFHAAVDDVRADLLLDYPDWDFVFLGLADADMDIWRKATERMGGPGSKFCRLEWPYGTHAYMVRARALPVLLDTMAVARRNLDQQLWEQVLSRNLVRWCVSLPTLVRQRTFDHEGGRNPEWFPSTLSPEDLPDEKQSEKPVDYWKVTTAEVETFTAAVDPFPCMYRGEPMRDDGVTPARRMMPLSECALLGSACHSGGKDVGEVTDPDGRPAVWCGSCPRRMQPAAAATRDRLDLPDAHFNPSLARYGGRLILATRDSWGSSRVALWELGAAAGGWSVSHVSNLGTGHPLAPRLEDPRLFTAPDPAGGGDRLHAMFNLPDAYPPRRVRVGYSRFSADLKRIEHTEVFESPHGCLYEKNWVPFWDAQSHEIRWVYSSKPRHTVLGSQVFSTDNDLPWKAGAVRGGAAPVLVRAGPDTWHPGNVYYHFFHGCLKRLQGSVYTVGCLAFEANPPFRVLRQTPTPLAWPDLPGEGEGVIKRYVLWPGGAVRDGSDWLLAVGVDDTFCRVLRIPAADVDAALCAAPESHGVYSIRDMLVDKSPKVGDRP